MIPSTMFLLPGVFVCYLLQPTCGGDLPDGAEGAPAGNEPLTATHEKKIMTPEMMFMHNTDSPPNQTGPERHSLAPPAHAVSSASPREAHILSDYPSDLFSLEDRRRGWVLLHLLGTVYMFVALAVVCDEFFVPSLWVIKDKLAISHDVIGATFMAVGRTIPRHFSLLIGAFISPSNVGFGSIVGSAVFKILFVIGASALFSRKVLHLTWWPHLRDASFYLLSLMLLIVSFLDNLIMWWESTMLVAVYVLYVIFLKFNVRVEQVLQTRLHKDRNSAQVVDPDAVLMSAASEVAEDPERDVDVAKLDEREEKEQKDEPLSLKWPETRRKQATFLFLLPISSPLWLTLPDVRNVKSQKFVAVTFLGSIVWILVFSYMMVWWAHQVGETLSIPGSIMGLTILAVGASVPDLITSGSLVRRGLADLLVSSAVACNIFDVTVGFPLAWLLHSLIHSSALASVSSSGLVCAAVLLFLVLAIFITAIASCKWRISRILGSGMLLLYLLFVAVSLMMQLHIIVCPLG